MKGSRFSCLRVALLLVLSTLITAGVYGQWPGDAPRGNNRPGQMTPGSRSGDSESSIPGLQASGDNAVDIHVAASGGEDLPALVHVEIRTDDSIGAGGPNIYKDGYADAKGYYSFANLPDGYYRVSVSAPGYLPKREEITLSHTTRASLRLEINSATAVADLSPDVGTVSVDWLSAPEKARKEYIKAHEDFAKQNYDGAIKQLRKALDEDSNFVYAYNELGLIYWNQEKYQDATEAFRRAMAINPKFYLAPLNLAQMWMSQKKYADAAPVLKQVAEQNPDRGEPFYLIGMLQFNVGNLDKAETALQEALKRDVSRVPEVYILLSNIYIRKQDRAKVTQALQSYLTAAPQGRYAKIARANLEKIKVESARQSAPTTASPAGAPNQGDSPR